MLSKSPKPRIRKGISRTISSPARWIHFTMWPDRDLAPVNLAAAFPQIADELFTRFELRARWLVAIEIAHQTNAERNVVQIVAVHVATVDLAPPTIAHFDLAIPGRCSVPNHEMVRKPVLHAADMPMIIIENARVALSCAAVMHDNELPTTPLHRRAPNRFDN